MPDYCTLFCAKKDHQLAAEIIKLIFPPAAITVTGQEHNWQRMAVRAENKSLLMHSRVPVKPSDDFSRVIRVTLDYFIPLPTGHLAHKEKILRTVGACQMIIGVMAQPAFDEEAGHYDCIFGLARGLQALIFNGISMIDPAGNVLLTEQRSFEWRYG